VATAVAVVVAPQRSSTALRVAVFLLAATAAVALVDRTRRRAPQPLASPFEPGRVTPVPAGPPADLARLAIELRAYDVLAVDGRAAVLPLALRRTARTIAASRLALHHGLTLDDPADQAAAVAACGPSLWAALDGEPLTISGAQLVSALGAL
jgi:hypothetical protein